MSKYNVELDMKTENSISIIANTVDDNSTVLEFGPDYGSLTRYLKTAKKCTIDIVEINMESGREASNYARISLLGEKEGNIENYIWLDRLKDNKYDYIIFADVLEHLYNPDNVLSKAKNLLKEDGKVLISIPNICHNSVLINMYNNKFTYTETGLLDNTHIRFWGLNNIEEFAKKAELFVTKLVPITVGCSVAEQSEFYDDSWNEINRMLEGREFGETYQFVVVLKTNISEAIKIEHKDSRGLSNCNKLSRELIFENIVKEYYADSILSLEQANKALLIEKEALLGENLNLIREIDEIKNSRVWRYGTKVAGAIIPYGSKRRKFAGKIINIFKKTNAHKTEAYHETKKANEVENIENPLSTIATSYVDEPCANFHEKVIILTREHCKHIAMAMKGCLENIGIDTQIISDIPKNGYENVYHIVICPQVFPEMPNKYIAFQMEQSISERWFDEDYIEKLHNAEAVFDYSLTNIKYLQEKGIAFEKIYYVPISFHGFYQGKTDVSKKEYDVLFYGDFNCERRKKILKQLGTIHKVKVINDLYGQQLEDEIRKSKIVINIHYYENALLETTRIFQVLSLNTAIVISEESSDMKEHEHLRGYVDFVEMNDVAKIIERVDYWLSNENRLIEKLENNRRLYESSMENKFEYGFYRYLLAKEIIDFEQFYSLAGDKVILKGDRWCLSIPESYERYNYFEDKNIYGFDCFMGLRHRIGWIGCGLSYKFLLRKAREYKLERVTICEDDVSVGEDFEVRYNKIYNYLSSIEKENWHLYAGLIADLSDDTNVIKVDMFEKEGYVYIDKTVSMVFNIYNSNFYEMLEGWNENDFDLEKNTIDRFIQNSLKVVAITNIPFLVEHEESLRSILWGVGNDCNIGMINNSKAKTLDKVKEYMARSEK